MRWRAALLIACSGACAALAAPEEYLVDPSHTYPHFEVRHLGISTQRGRFERTDGRIVLDAQAGQGSIDISIDAGTVSTGNRLLDAQLKGEDFFDTERFPAITFRATRLEFDKEKPKLAVGELTMLGVTRPVSVTVEWFGCTRLPFFIRLTCGADVVAKISRSAFGMTSYAGLIGDDVRIEVQIEAVRQEKAAEPSPAGG
jgi:polyisoprenoid-binding protein YceI